MSTLIQMSPKIAKIRALSRLSELMSFIENFKELEKGKIFKDLPQKSVVIPRKFDTIRGVSLSVEEIQRAKKLVLDAYVLNGDVFKYHIYSRASLARSELDGIIGDNPDNESMYRKKNVWYMETDEGADYLNYISDLEVKFRLTSSLFKANMLSIYPAWRLWKNVRELRRMFYSIDIDVEIYHRAMNTLLDSISDVWFMIGCVHLSVSGQIRSDMDVSDSDVESETARFNDLCAKMTPEFRELLIARLKCCKDSDIFEETIESLSK